MQNREASMLTQKQVKELFDYDAETGNLIWRCNLARKKTVGKIAGTLHPTGYWQIQVFRKIFRAHRLVWLWNYGDFPTNDLDHINGLRSDNRIENLREATKGQNAQNRRTAQKNNQCGYLGVSRKRNKWRTTIRASGKELHIGAYDTPEEAHDAYLAKKRELHPFGTL